MFFLLLSEHVLLLSLVVFGAFCLFKLINSPFSVCFQSCEFQFHGNAFEVTLPGKTVDSRSVGLPTKIAGAEQYLLCRQNTQSSLAMPSYLTCVGDDLK